METPIMTTNEKSTKDAIITEACDAIDFHAARAEELARQRNALLLAVAVLATWILV